MRLGPHSVTVLRAATAEDNYGNDARDWADATQTPVTGCSVQPEIGPEITAGRDTIVSRWRLFAPDGTDLLATDRVLWDGGTYEVDGEPMRWGFPPLAHVVALLRKANP